MKDNFVITIGRQFGSGGHQIGRQLAGQLGISFYDKELIRLASQQSGLKEELFEQMDERRRFSLFGGVLGLQGIPVEEYYADFYLSNETLFRIQADVIREIAGKDSALFVGRCADYILQSHPRAFHLFICADLDDRISRVSKRFNLAAGKAGELITKTDKQRASFYNHFTSKIWGAVESYHLCINSSFLGIEATVEFIHQMAARKFAL